MAKPPSADLLKFLKPFPAEVQETVLRLRDFVWTLYPQANELIYDNYNAVAFGWSVTDKLGHTFCTTAAFRTNHNIHFGFYFGSQLSDPKVSCWVRATSIAMCWFEIGRVSPSKPSARY